MKPNRMIPMLIACMAMPAAAQTTINSSNKYSYGSNIGWMDWRGDGTNGAVAGMFVCSGSIYSANVGWINLGSGVPANGMQYQNNGATDFGVNLSNAGKLRGYAYGANIGWINFENLGDPHINLLNGKFGGSVFSANCGWISLNTLFVYVQIDTLQPGPDTDNDGLPDTWERVNFNNSLSGGANDDDDGDGQSSLEEYLADTNPNDPASVLAITSHSSSGGISTTLTWKSMMSRNYRIEQSTDLGTWFDSGLGIIPPAGTTTSDAFAHPYSPKRFFRVLAVNPLAP